MPIRPGMVEDLAAGTRDLYEQAEHRLLGIIGRQTICDLDRTDGTDPTLPLEH
ncbi:hypothetical protein [Streptomyces sp. NPDC058695]|uniref:hypothetical protein n=1 Tax=Streptomyces sp. NPDC058695 TaxID=3346604 RepID=UPI0036599994